MRKAHTRIIVRLDRVEFPESPWDAHYLNQEGVVEWIELASHGGYVFGIRFPLELDTAIFGMPLPWGFTAFSDSSYLTHAMIIEGNPHTAYYGEWTDELTEKWLSSR